MKRKYVTSFYLLLIALATVLAVSACSQKNAAKELLVVWGQERFDDNDCSIQVVDPDTQTAGSVLQVEAPCYFYTIESEGVTKLVQFRDYSDEIKIFGVTPQLTVEVERILEVKDVMLTSVPVWAADGAIYVGGIWREREQILRVDSQTGEVSPFIVNEEGIATAPSFSPDGKYLLYVTFAGRMTTNECRLDCYSKLRLFNMETGEDVSLSSIIEPAMVNPVFTQCGGNWSPTGDYQAFTIGCYASESPNQIIVLDMETNQIVSDVRPIFDDTNVGQLGWFSAQELIFSQLRPVEGETFRSLSYYIHSLETNLTTEVVELPDFYSDGTVFSLLDIDWTRNQDFIVGIYGRNAEGNSPLIVIEINSEPLQITLLETESFNTNPLWSPSGKWIAYKTTDEVFALDTDVKVINRDGSVLVNTGLNDMAGDLLRYMWLSQ